MKVEVMEVNEDTALQAFDGKVKLQSLLNYVAQEARAYDLDASTLAGRKEIASVAYKVSRSKTLIDSVGKDIVSKWKDQCKAVDAQRKEARDFLDALRDEIRQPVTDWENEQKRIQEEEIRKEEEAQAARLAELERREAELKAREDAERARAAAEQAEKERIEREKQIAEEAAERAKREAEEKVAREKAEAEQREREAVEAKERAEREAREAKELAEYRAKQAKIQAEEDAKRAVEAEKARAKAEQERIEREAKAREADREHRRTINNEALSGLIAIGMKKSEAKTVIEAIACSAIPHVRISY